MKKIKVLIICLLINFNINTKSSGQTLSVYSIKLVESSPGKLLIDKIPVNNFILTGTEQNIENFLSKSQFVKESIICNGLMSGKTFDEIFKSLNPILYNENKLNGSTNNILISLDNTYDFVSILKEEEEINKAKEEDDKCELEASVCIGSDEASFSIGCKDGFSIEISTSGTIKLTADRNGASIGVDLISK